MVKRLVNIALNASSIFLFTTSGRDVRNNNWQSMKERIVNESATLFLHKGFQGTTIKDITDAVGLTKGAFYWYFKTKDDLLETILEEWEKTFLDGLIESDKRLKAVS